MAKYQSLIVEHGYWAITESDIAPATTATPLGSSNKEELTYYPLKRVWFLPLNNLADDGDSGIKRGKLCDNADGEQPV